MASSDGNGWVDCGCGHRHWGRHGAAGLVLVRTVPHPQVLLQLRAGWTHEGGRWGMVGGARDSHESIPQAALREAGEEAGIDPAQVTVIDTQVGVDHGQWSYTYVIAIADADVRIGPITDESEALRWVDLVDVATLPLHSGLGQTWPAVRARIDAALKTAGPS